MRFDFKAENSPAPKAFWAGHSLNAVDYDLPSTLGITEVQPRSAQRGSAATEVLTADYADNTDGKECVCLLSFPDCLGTHLPAKLYFAVGEKQSLQDNFIPKQASV